MLQVGRVKSIGTKCKKPSLLCATFLSSTHPTGPSNLGFIHSSHSFWNYFSVVIQHLPGILAVIFLGDLALLLHAFCFLFQEEISHPFKILTYENSINSFFSLRSPRAAHPSPSRWIELQVKKEHAGWIQLQEKLGSHLHATEVGLHAWWGAILNQQDRVASVRLQPLPQ